MKKKYTIAVCTYNRAKLLPRALKSIALQQLKDVLEVIVVDNNSTDNTFEIVEKFQNEMPIPLRYIRETKKGISHVRNRAISEVKTNYLLFLDDDAWASPDWIMNLIRQLNNEHIHETPFCIVGPVKLVWEGDGRPNWFPERYESLLCEYNFGPTSLFLSKNDYLLTTNVLFHTETIKKIGGFKTDLGRIGDRTLGGEDNEIFQRLYKNNYKVWYQADALVFHPVPVERQRESYLIERLFWDGASQPLLNDNPINKFILFRKILYEYRNILSLMLRPLTKRSAFTLDNKLEISQRRGKVFMYSKILKKKIIGVSCTSALPH